LNRLRQDAAMSEKRPTATGRRSNAGRKPMWGPRSPMTVHWPEEHLEHYKREARKAGVSPNEYIIRLLAEVHGLIPEQSGGAEPQQLALGA
jgi:hypothetical protein